MLLVRRNDGWGTPAFYNMAGVTLGAQLGAEGGAMAFILNDQKALNGFMQMVVAFGVGAWLGVALEDRSTCPLALGIGFWSLVLALLAWTVVQRHGAQASPDERA